MIVWLKQIPKFRKVVWGTTHRDWTFFLVSHPSFFISFSTSLSLRILSTAYNSFYICCPYSPFFFLCFQVSLNPVIHLQSRYSSPPVSHQFLGICPFCQFFTFLSFHMIGPFQSIPHQLFLETFLPPPSIQFVHSSVINDSTYSVVLCKPAPSSVVSL